MDMLLMTSKYESLPLMVLHALAHGIPVVSSDVGGINRCLGERSGRTLPVDASPMAYAEAVLEWRGRNQGDQTIDGHCRDVLAGRFTKARMRRQLVDDISSLAARLNLEDRRKDYQLDLMKKPLLW